MKLLKNENINFQINNSIHSNVKTPHRIFIKKNKNQIKYKFLNNEFFKNIAKIKINYLNFNFNFLKLIFFYQINFNIFQDKHFLFKNLNSIENIIEKFFYLILNFLNLFSFLSLNLIDKKNIFLFLKLNQKFFDKNRFKKVKNFYITNKKEKLRNNLKKNDKLFLTYYSIPYAFSNLGKEILYESSQTENFSFIGEKFNFKKQFFYFYNLRLYNLDELKESKEEVRKFFFNIPFHHLAFKALPFIVAEKNHNLFFKYNRKANLRLKFRENQLNSLVNMSYTINFFKSLFLFKKRQLYLIFKKINQKTYQFNKKTVFHNRLKKIYYQNNDLKQFKKKNLTTFYTLSKFLDKTKFYLKTYFTKLKHLNIEKNKINLLSKFLNFKKTNFYYKKFESNIINKNLIYFKRKSFLTKRKKFSFFKNNLKNLKKLTNFNLNKIVKLTKKKVINLFFATKKNKFITLKSYNKQLQKFTFFSHNYLKNYLLSDEKNNKNAFFFKHKKKKIKFLINKINQSKFKNLKLNFSRNKLVKKNLTKLNFFLTNFAIHFKEINQKQNLKNDLFLKFFFKKSKKLNIFNYLLSFIFTFRKKFDRNFINFNFKFLKLIKKIIKNTAKCQKLIFFNKIKFKNKIKNYKNYFKFFNFLNNFKFNKKKKNFKKKFGLFFTEKKLKKKIPSIMFVISERKRLKKLGKKNLTKKKKKRKLIKKLNLNRLNFAANNKLMLNLLNQKKFSFINLKEKKIFFKLKKILNSFDLLVNFYLNNILLCKSQNEFDDKTFSKDFKEKYSIFFFKKFKSLKKNLNLLKKIIKNNLKFKQILKVLFKQLNFLIANLNFYKLSYLINPVYFFKKQIHNFKLIKKKFKLKFNNKVNYLKYLFLLIKKSKKTLKKKNKIKILLSFCKKYKNLLILKNLTKKTVFKYRKKLFYLYFVTFLKLKLNSKLKNKLKKKLFQKSKIVLDFKEEDLFDYVEDQVYYEIQTLSFIKKNLNTILLYNNKLLHLKNNINLHD